jgi:hypothetical protein
MMFGGADFAKHKKIIELWDVPVLTRGFADWQMGLAQPRQTELTAISTACWKHQLDDAESSTVTSPGFLLLKGFWRRSLRS